jgi:hypothetical protein
MLVRDNIPILARYLETIPLVLFRVLILAQSLRYLGPRKNCSYSDKLCVNDNVYFESFDY